MCEKFYYSIRINNGSTSSRYETIKMSFLDWEQHLVTSNEEIEAIRKIAKSFEESGLLINCVFKAKENEAK